MDAKEYYKQELERQIKYLHIDEYHKQGYKGRKITILNAEGLPGKDGHGEMTTGVINDYAPEATVINSIISGSTSGDKVLETYVTINGEKIDFEEAIDRFNIKIVTRSYSGSTPKARLDYFKDIQRRKGIIFFCAAGNNANDGVTGIWAKDNTSIAVGAARIKENGKIERMYYSSTGEELDFMCFMGTGSGTSAASPALAAMTALLLQRYGDFNQAECVEILKSISVDLGDVRRDNSHGYGLPILPLSDRLEILERLRGVEEMPFKDIEETRWSKNFIKICVDEGLLQGYDDGTFKPTAPITREEVAVILVRILDKIEGRI